ncbi:MAG: serine O-acetyltransferase, partial [Eubacterium sp.]
VGVPGEIVRIDGERVDDLDQINIPDPIMNAITENQKKIKELEDKIKALEDVKNESIQHNDKD